MRPWLLLALAFVAPSFARAQPPEPVARPQAQPYNVRVLVAFDDVPEFSPRVRTRIIGEIKASIERFAGGMWDSQVEEHRTLIPATSAALAKLKPADFPGEIASKTYVLTIERRGAQFHLAGREWDGSSRALGPLTAADASDTRELATDIVALLHRLFRPVAEIDQVNDAEVSLSLCAGERRPSDPDWRQNTDDALWSPFYRRRGVQNEPDQVQTIPWTYLTVEPEESDAAAGAISCRLWSGLRSPLTNRRTLRVSALALAQPPRAGEARLRLASIRNPALPLAGLDVEISHEKDEPTVRLVSDRKGTVRIRATAERPLAWLTVWSGRNALAHVPLAPGLQPVAVLELPDDSARLQVEGEIAILQANLMDVVAERAVLISRARKLAREGDWKQTDALLPQLAKLPNADAYLQQVSNLQIPAVRAARDRQDKTTALRIEHLCKDTRQLVQRYLDEDKMREFKEEISELRRISKESGELVPESKPPVPERQPPAPEPKPEEPPPAAPLPTRVQPEL